ncbi:MAG: tryptophan synthase subunit alpha [Thermomonas hydrothermalis]|uniref:tryptophan synthase subunit alpha n=1 Tax=Thermomonas hydrothermalis TaxID=213588 RepID=UPI002354B780|nr:tryptophan synthase subunit alpha [Thermomonas hydrothermalis]MCL6619710.1 tryptophan synthase subunit alpha [Thermomonas hydrothermalis]
MTRLQRRLAALGAAGRKALVPFITAGDPLPEATVPVMHALVQAGADVLELGVPFSDPMADGPVIQRSSERALARGVGLSQVLDWVRAFRVDDADTPVVLMGYLNPVEIRGAETFAAQAAEAGVDGVLLVDLPPEEAEGYRQALGRHGLVLIALASPTTPPSRLEAVCAQAEGYLYYVSYAGVTGASRLDVAEAAGHLAQVRARTRVPVMAGFGIRDARSAVAMAAHADGVVVGSALVSVLDGSQNADEAAARARAFLQPLRLALDGGPVAA